jgi:hypothetical protein
MNNVSSPSTASNKPLLVVVPKRPNETVAPLRDLLAQHEELFDRNGPVRVFRNADGVYQSVNLTESDVVRLGHDIAFVAKEVETASGTQFAPEEISERIAKMYLRWAGGWNLRRLAGFATSPLLRPDGSFVAGDGYDPETGIVLDKVPDLSSAIPPSPTEREASDALHRLRSMFRTFAFADATFADEDGYRCVDLDAPIGHDESAFLYGLLTAVTRPSLETAPGLLITAPLISGAGTGKGLLARCVGLIGFGHKPKAMNFGNSQTEFNKRLSAALLRSDPVFLLDNLNDATLRSDQLATVLTESRAEIRPLGRSEVRELNTQTMLIVTGNGLGLTEDLIRRFLHVRLEAGTENPESRIFPFDVVSEVAANRERLLIDALTIWRWGRTNGGIVPGKPLGSYSTWSSWVRDPLLALGVKDPVDRIAAMKSEDPARTRIAEMFERWWQTNGDRWFVQADLPASIFEDYFPDGYSRQRLATELKRLQNVRIAGFHFHVEKGGSKWVVDRYRLTKESR